MSWGQVYNKWLCKGADHGDAAYRADQAEERIQAMERRRIQDLLARQEIIDRLLQEEGATVAFCCANPDFNGLPNHCVTVCGEFTGWAEKDFRADTVLDCLRAAEESKRVWEGGQA